MNTDKIYAEKLAGEYAPKDDSKVVRLKKLDKKAKQPAVIFGYVFGIGMTLLFGTGMSLCMKAVGPGTPAMTAVGIVIGLCGIAGAFVNYPICKKLLENGRRKYAFEILELAKEISDTAE